MSAPLRLIGGARASIRPSSLIGSASAPRLALASSRVNAPSARLASPLAVALARRDLSLWPGGWAQRHSDAPNALPTEPVDVFATSSQEPAPIDSIGVPASTGAVEPASAIHVGDSIGQNIPVITEAGVQTRSLLAEYDLGQTWFAGTAQKVLEWVHITTGLPWWGTIVLTVVIIRMCTFPIIRKSLINGAKTQELTPRIKELTDKMAAAKRADKLQPMQQSAKELQDLLRDNNVKPFRYILLSLGSQMPVFIALFLGLRGFASAKFPGFETQGLSWFTDLTVSDPYYVLPLLSSALTVAVIQSGAEAATPNQQSATIKNGLSGLLVVSVPFIAYFPSAVFVYWVTNNSWSLAQVFLLKVPAFRRLIAIPPLPEGAPVSPVAENFQAIAPPAKFSDAFRAGMAMQEIAVAEGQHAANSVAMSPAPSAPRPPIMIKDHYVPASRNEANKVSQAQREAAFHRDFILKASAAERKKQEEATAAVFARANAKPAPQTAKGRADEKQRRTDAALSGRRSFSTSVRANDETLLEPRSSSDVPVVPLDAFRSDDVDAERRRAAWQNRVTRDHLLGVGLAAAKTVAPADAQQAARQAVLDAPGGSEEVANSVGRIVRRAYFARIAYDNATTSLSESSAQAAASAVQRAGGLPGEVASTLATHAHRAAAQKAHSIRRMVDERRRIKSWRVARGSGRRIMHDPRPNRRERRLVSKAYHRRARQESRGTWKRILGWRVGSWDQSAANALSKERRFARGTLEEALRKRDVAAQTIEGGGAGSRKQLADQRVRKSASRKASSKLPRIVGSSS